MDSFECKFMLMFCVGIVHTNVYNCNEFRPESFISNYVILHPAHVVDARKCIQYFV